MIKDLPADAGDARDMGLIPRSRRHPGVGNGDLLQYSCLGNPMNRLCPSGNNIEAQEPRWGHKESDRTEWLTTEP